MSRLPAVGTFTLLVLVAGPVHAQSRPAAPDRWPPPLAPERAVWVVLGDDPAGVKGEVVELTDTSLSLRRGQQLQRFAREDIRRIDVRDSLVNGTLIGATVGAAGVGLSYALLAEAICSGCGDETANTLEWTALGAAIGALAGLSIDAFHAGRRVVYVSPAVGPSPRQALRFAGATVTVAW